MTLIPLDEPDEVVEVIADIIDDRGVTAMRFKGVHSRTKYITRTEGKYDKREILVHAEGERTVAIRITGSALLTEVIDILQKIEERGSE